MENLIPIMCFSNLDAFKTETWPKFVVCRPMVGDRIASEGGHIAKIVAVEHYYCRREEKYYLALELHTIV